MIGERGHQPFAAQPRTHRGILALIAHGPRATVDEQDQRGTPRVVWLEEVQALMWLRTVGNVEHRYLPPLSDRSSGSGLDPARQGSLEAMSLRECRVAGARSGGDG